MLDLSPAREAASMLFPVAEYLFQAYLVACLIRSYQATSSGELPRWYMPLTTVFTAVAMISLAEFRLVFVVLPTTSVAYHTYPFMGMQVGLLLIATQTVVYYYLVGHVPLQTLLGRRVAVALSVFYLLCFAVVTLLKIIIIGSILSGSPVVDTKQPSGRAVAQVVDQAWTIFATLIPLAIAFSQRRHSPPMVLQMRPYGGSGWRASLKPLTE